MRSPSGDLHVVDFKTNQIVSVIQPKDYWDDKRHWEIKNNIDTLEFRVFENTDHATTLVQQNLVLKEVRGGRIVPYVIKETEKDSKDRSLMVYASGEWIQLAKAGIIEPQKIESKTLKQCMEIALKGTKWTIGKTEHDGAHSMVIEEFTDPLDLLKKIAASFELEIQYRAEVVGAKIVGRYVDMVRKRGRDTRKEVTFGKDLIGIKRIENSQSICTALLGFVKKENGEFITISSINKGVPYLVDDAAYQRWNENGKHKFAFYTPQTDDQNMSPERLLTLMKTEMGKLVNTSVSYEVDTQNIARIPGLSHEEINEGDTIRIIDRGFTPKLYLEARAIVGDESFKDPTQDKYVFGDYREIVDSNEELRRMYQKVLSSLYDKVPQDLFDQLKDRVNEQNETIIDAKDKADQAQKESQTAKDLAEATQKYMEQNMVDIIEQPTAPTENLRDGKTLWIDNSDPENKVQKLWKDGQWQRVTPDTGPLQQSIKDVQKDIETTKTELNKKVQEAQDQATGQFNEVQESLQGVSRTISDVQNEQGNINKKVTQIEQTSEGVKTSIELLTKNDDEINNKLNVVESTVEGTKKTISDVQQTTSELKKTTTEIKEQAGKISEKLESIETKVDNTKLDGRNSLKNSNFSSYIVNNSIGWDNSLNGNLYASVWGSGYNGGVADSKRGYHAHLDTTTFGYPVVVFINKNSIIGQKNRWMGISGDVIADFARNNVAGKEITISMDIWSDTKDFRVNGGLYHFIEGNTGQSFHSGQYVFNVSEVNRWERYTFTMKLHNKYDISKVARFYIYGGEGIEGTAYVKNVKLELANIATAWTPAPEDQVTTDEFFKKTTEIEKSVDGVKTTISTVQKDQNSMQSTLNKVEQTTNSNSQSITSLSQTQGKQGEIIQQNTSDITQLNNQIKSKVSDTQMQDYVGGLGSTNIIANSAFEDRVINSSSGIVVSRTPSLSKWKIQGTGTNKTVIVDSARNHDGYNSVKISSSGYDASQFVGIAQTFSVSQNSGNYVFSAWFYVENKALLETEGGVIKLQFFNGSTSVITIQTEIQPKLVNTQWVRIDVKTTVPNTPITSLRADIWVRRNGIIWVSQPQLQQGITPSTFMENPKDYANYDQLVGEIAKKVATTDFNSKVSTLETSITQQSNRIDFKAERTDVYTKTEANGQFGSKAIVDSHTSSISLMSDQINQRVVKGEIASTINQTAQSVLIQANKIYLDGFIEAKHLKAQTLQGVTIQTAPQGSGNNQIRLNAQNMTLYGRGANRGYFGFIENSNGKIRTALALGNDYTNNNNVEGSLFLEHNTPTNNNYKLTDARIGIATSRNTDGSINMNNYIAFQPYGTLSIASSYGIDLRTTGSNLLLETQGSGNSIDINSSSHIYNTAVSGNFFFRAKRNTTAEEWSARLYDNSGTSDLDFNLANLVTLRVARQYPYSQDGLQIKNNKGNAWESLSCGVLKYSSLSQRSSRDLKTAIKYIEAINPLDKLMELTPRQYYMKSDINKLYEKRQEIIDSGSGERTPTYKDIPLQYGFIAEEVPDEFATPNRKAVNMYPLITMGIAGTQEVYRKHLALEETIKAQGDRIAKLEELLLQQLINKKPEQQ
ncbi:peptidase S74 [Bacillus cereus]|nr:peptidase S74 [Bacillus cereus]PGU66183.1 peptidase S74 [Bacillus cereus]